MDGYISPQIRGKRIFRCSISNGHYEEINSVKEVAADNKEEAERLYRKQNDVDIYYPVMVLETEESNG